MPRFYMRIDPKDLREFERMPEYMKAAVSGASWDLIDEAVQTFVETARHAFYDGEDRDTHMPRTPYTGAGGNAIYHDDIREVKGRAGQVIGVAAADGARAPQVVYYEEDMSASDAAAIVGGNRSGLDRWIVNKLGVTEERRKKIISSETIRKRSKHGFGGRHHLAQGLAASRDMLRGSKGRVNNAMKYSYKAGRVAYTKKSDRGQYNYKAFGDIQMDASGRETLNVQ